MNKEEKREFEQLKLTIKGLEETLTKLQTCATIIKDVVSKSSGVDINKLMADKMKEDEQNV